MSTIMTLRNVYEFSKRQVKSGLVWSITLSIMLSMNGEIVSMPVICTIGQHFDQFYCRQLKNDAVR